MRKLGTHWKEGKIGIKHKYFEVVEIEKHITYFYNKLGGKVKCPECQIL